MNEELEPGALLAQGKTAAIYAAGKDRILKLFVKGFPASLIEREAAGMHAAEAGNLPVPRLLQTVTVDGRQGLVMERVRGHSMLQLLAREPTHTSRFARMFAELQAQVHSCSGTGLPSCSEDMARRIARAGVLARVKGNALAVLELLPDGNALCHGNLHPGNVLVTAKGPCLINWDAAVCGNPAADAARTALILRIGDAPGGMFASGWTERETRNRFYQIWLKRYRELRPEAADVWNWLLPVAVARLAADIPAERPRLLQLIEQLQKTP